jgi:hypothetical protein
VADDAYILFVNPAILGFAGVPDLEPLGLPFAQVLPSPRSSPG